MSTTPGNRKVSSPSTPAPFVQSLAVLQEFSIEEAEVIHHWMNHSVWPFGRNRSQFVANFPLLAPIVISKAAQGHPSYMAIEAAIDRGAPLIDTMAGEFRVRKGTLRFLRGKGPALVGSTWLGDPIELLWAIETSPAERRPRSAREWEMFHTLWRCLGSWKRDPLEDHVFSSLCSAGHEASVMKLDTLFQGDLGRTEGIYDYFRFVADWCDRLSKQQPEAIDPEAEPVFEGLLIRYSGMELFRQSERWHLEIGKLHAIETAPDMDEAEFSQWPGLLPGPLEVDHGVLIPLTSSQQLAVEGSLLEHCVSGYSDSCLLGDSHILSIRNDDGQCLSTVEINLKKGPDGRLTPVLIQHRGRKNGTPSRKCRQALAQALQRLQEPVFQTHLQEIAEFHANRRSRVLEYLNFGNARLSIESMSELMARVLNDYDHAMAWLARAMSGKPKKSRPLRLGPAQLKQLRSRNP